MSQAEDLLNSLADDGSWTDTNNHIVIGSDRYWIVPEDVKKIAVENDHNIETVTFDCPRYWDGKDMSQMLVYINYMRADDEKGADLATNVFVDEEDDTIMHFNWTITGHLSAVQGPVTTLVCIQKVAEDGTEERHWNSELCTDLYVSPGMECEAEVIAHYPGIITALLHRMDYVEEITTPEYMREYVANYFKTNPDVPELIKTHLYEYMAATYPTTEDAMQEYVNMYMKEHPPLFVIGNSKPGISCLWFNTDDDGSGEENVTFKLLPDSDTESVYAEVDGTAIPSYNFDIL